MSAIGRWLCATATFFLSAGLQGLGRDFIRASHPPLDPLDFSGLMMICASFWLLINLNWPWKVSA